MAKSPRKILTVDERTVDAELFRNIDLFRGCSLKEIETYLARFAAVAITAKRGDVIVHERQKAKWIIVVLKGTLELYDHGSKSVDTLVRVFEAGGFLGMSFSMKKDEYYPCMIVAGAAAELLMLDAEKIRQAWYEPGYKKFYTNLLDCFSRYVWFCRSKFAILNLRDAEDRIMLYLKTRSEELGTNEFSVPFVNTRQMADFLGITRTSLSRSIAKLVREGRIDHPGKGFFIVKR